MLVCYIIWNSTALVGQFQHVKLIYAKHHLQPAIEKWNILVICGSELSALEYAVLTN